MIWWMSNTMLMLLSSTKQAESSAGSKPSQARNRDATLNLEETKSRIWLPLTTLTQIQMTTCVLDGGQAMQDTNYSWNRWIHHFQMQRTGKMICRMSKIMLMLLLSTKQADSSAGSKPNQARNQEDAPALNLEETKSRIWFPFWFIQFLEWLTSKLAVLLTRELGISFPDYYCRFHAMVLLGIRINSDAQLQQQSGHYRGLSRLFQTY